MDAGLSSLEANQRALELAAWWAPARSQRRSRSGRNEALRSAAPLTHRSCLSPVPTGFLIGDARHKLGGPKVFPMAVMVRPGRNRARSVRYQTVVGTAFDRNVASRAFNNVSQSRGAQEVTHVTRKQKNSRRPGALEQG